MRRIVPLASLFGIITSLLVGLFTAARLVMVAARAWLLPPFLATVSKRTLTPVIAQLILGVIIAILALELGYTQLTEMVNFGTLFGMWAVCNTLLYRRYYPDIKFTFTQFGTIETKTQSEEPVWHVPGARLPMRMRRWLSLIHIILLNSVCIGKPHNLSPLSHGQPTPLPYMELLHTPIHHLVFLSALPLCSVCYVLPPNNPRGEELPGRPVRRHATVGEARQQQCCRLYCLVAWSDA